MANPAEYLSEPYTRLVIPESDGSFRAEVLEFPGCVAAGENPAEALETLEEVAADWISVTLNQGQNIPAPLDSAGYSGKLVIRMPKGVHKKAAQFAEREGVSLNQFIVTCIAEQVGMRAVPRLQAMTAGPNLQVVGIWLGSPAGAGLTTNSYKATTLSFSKTEGSTANPWGACDAGG
jgi:predicted RNase H-like HicB family nuclease